MTNLLSPPANNFGVGGVVQEFIWSYANHKVRIAYEVLGNGSPLLLLPAFSTVSSREEMAGLAKLLAPHFQVFAVDWPGFGDSERLNFDYKPALYQQFLTDFVTFVFGEPITVIAAGHATVYVLKIAKQQPSRFARILLVAPTWRGPLPTMGLSRNAAGIIKNIVRSPILGQFLYKLNTLPSFLRFMYRRHVFADESKLTQDFIEHKWQITKKIGARYGSGAFVTGTLDVVENQADFLALAENSSVPLMVIIGDSSPPKSRAQMDALAALTGVRSTILPGTLGMHEEYANNVFEASLSFLKSGE